jgi:hypothetical protein
MAHAPIAADIIGRKKQEISSAIAQSWAADTSSYQADWTASTPSLGQCAVTALVVQEQLGGEIVRVVYSDNGKKDSHYFNILPTGEILDLTREQFSAEAAFNPPLNSPVADLIAATKRYIQSKNFHSDGNLVHDYLLSNDTTKQRYETLNQRVEKAIIATKAPFSRAS